MSEANEVVVNESKATVKDSETEIVQKKALGLIREAELRVEKEKYDKYLGYVKNFATTELKKTECETITLSADEIKAVDFLMVPRAKKAMKIWGLGNLAYIGGISALAIFLHPAFLIWLLLLLLNIPTGVGSSTIGFLQKRRVALEYLKKKEAAEAQVKTED